MPICPKCGKEVTPGSLFCGGCGAKMEEAAAPQPEQAGQQSQPQYQQNPNQYQQNPNQYSQQGQGAQPNSAPYQQGYNNAPYGAPYTPPYHPPFPGTAVGYDQNDIAQNRVLCAVSYIPPLFFLPLIACKNSPYGRFHANQSLLLLLLSVAVGIVFGVTTAIFKAIYLFPIAALLGVISWLASLGILALTILGIIWTAQGEAKEIPIIGKIRIIK